VPPEAGLEQQEQGRGQQPRSDLSPWSSPNQLKGGRSSEEDAEKTEDEKESCPSPAALEDGEDLLAKLHEKKLHHRKCFQSQLQIPSQEA
jgi:hypothetical protein